MCAAGHALGVSRPIKIWRVEVWGCGGAAALGQQEREKLRDRQAAEHRQKVGSEVEETRENFSLKEALRLVGFLLGSKTQSCRLARQPRSLAADHGR